MTMLPRNMISPIVCAVGRHLAPSSSGSQHRHAFLERVAHALAAVQAGLLGQRLLPPSDGRLTATAAGP